jgi:hypothetical protein
MEPIQDDIEAVRSTLNIFTALEFNGLNGEVVIRDALAALDRLVAERDRLNGQVNDLVDGMNVVIEDRKRAERWYEESKAERDRLIAERGTFIPREYVRAMAERDRYREALERIAAWGMPSTVNPVKSIAREALTTEEQG